MAEKTIKDASKEELSTALISLKAELYDLSNAVAIKQQQVSIISQELASRQTVEVPETATEITETTEKKE